VLRMCLPKYMKLFVLQLPATAGGGAGTAGGVGSGMTGSIAGPVKAKSRMSEWFVNCDGSDDKSFRAAFIPRLSASVRCLSAFVHQPSASGSGSSRRGISTGGKELPSVIYAAGLGAI
jgi:hypothetical protein